MRLKEPIENKVSRRYSLSILEDVIILHAGRDEYGNAVPALDVLGQPPIMNGVTLKYSAFDGIHLYKPEDSFIIENSVVADNRGHGIFINSSVSQVTLGEMKIRGNGGDGVHFSHHDSYGTAPAFCDTGNIGEEQIYPVRRSHVQRREQRYVQACEQVDRSQCAVRNCWKQWTREGTHARKTGSGATRKTTRREDQRIVRQALVDLTVTRSTIRAEVGVAIVPQTISRHLTEANLKSKHPFRALPLTPEHRLLRLQWCQARSMWNVIDWQKVVFSDESRFVLGTDDNRVRVWRHPVRVAQDFLRHFQTLPWSARSADLSPVENVWDQLKRQMPSCHSVHDLELAVQDLWAHLLRTT
ncbi:transposable element Tc1 transposase [Trichonephila clavipes]|nr:transposable element Tc1 transposase [Trichonephila clavipes]